jgi:hypothetical protein
VDDNVFSEMASMNVSRAWAWSRVLESLIRSPTGLVEERDCLRSVSEESGLDWPGVCWTSSRGRMSLPLEMGRTFSSSSRTRQSAQEPRERMNRSLKRATTES